MIETMSSSTNKLIMEVICLSPSKINRKTRMKIRIRRTII